MSCTRRRAIGELAVLFWPSQEKVEMKSPPHFFSGYEKLVHPVATGNSAEDVMESDGESEGEGDGEDVMKEAETAAGPLLAGQMQFSIPEYIKINYADVVLTPSCPIGCLLEPTEEEGRDQCMEHSDGGGAGGGPVTEGVGPSDSPVTDIVTHEDGPVTEGVGLSDVPVTEEELCAVCSDLGMCERDTSTALSVLRAVREAGPIGRPVNDVRKVRAGLWKRG